MLGSMGLRAAVVSPLAVLVLTGRVQMWEVYAIAVVFGVVDAFFMPARSSILPRVVADHELEPGNAVLNVTAQASVILGPVLGGVIVAVLDGPSPEMLPVSRLGSCSSCGCPPLRPPPPAMLTPTAV